MIRFKTIEPGEQDKPATKPVAAPPAIVAPPPPAEQPDDGQPAAKSKGLSRKTPLRAKKPDAARLFRD